MAAIGTGNPTLLDQIKRTDPDGNIAQIVEALTESNPILQDATAMAGNLPTGHRLTIRSGLPTVGWRMLNQGIDASKSTTIQVDETCGLLEGRSEVDCELARLNGNEAAFRASEDRAFLQALNIEAADALIYASTKTDPEKILGFTPRYNAISGAGNADNIVDYDALYEQQTGSGDDRRSIWFITWGPETAYMIYPKGTQAGISSEDLGKEYIEDAASKKFLAWRTHWIWRLGLCIKDWRYHVRICNIDPDGIGTDIAHASAPLLQAMVDAYSRIRDFNSGRTVCYMSREMLSWIDRTVMLKSNVYFTPMEWHGRRITGFRGIPIVICDTLATDEDAVS
jgi:hypothetical protein